MAKVTSQFKCTECGWQSAKWVGRCGECQQWGTVIEAGAEAVRPKTTAQTPIAGSAARPISSIDSEPMTHEATGIGEFDRVLGGGIVPGAAILLSGEPGIGKSTLLLDIAAKISRGKRILYISAEESEGQVALRAKRTGNVTDNLFLASVADLAVALGHIDQSEPEMVILDSVQAITSPIIDAASGSPTQVREVAGTIVNLAKTRGIPVLLIGHVTKDGNLAGPRTLEHMVDVVLSFDGDRGTSLRFLRSVKNRFGPTDEIGCFEMTGDGIREIPDPSGLFLTRTGENVSGTCITMTLEGRRVIPVEIQALVSISHTPQPRRVVSGVDTARVAMLVAILERRLGMRLAERDIYVSTVGGIRVTEPAADLAICMAIASASKDKALPAEAVAIGEVALSGEVRVVPAAERRKAEATRLGFKVIADGTTRISEAIEAAGLGNKF